MCVNPGITYSKYWVSKGYNKDQILRRKSINVNWLFRLFKLVLCWMCGKFWNFGRQGRVLIAYYLFHQ